MGKHFVDKIIVKITFCTAERASMRYLT